MLLTRSVSFLTSLSKYFLKKLLFISLVPNLFKTSEGLCLNSVVSRVAYRLKDETGPMMNMQKKRRASIKPPTSPNKSSKLYVSRLITFLSPLKLSSQLVNLYFREGFSLVGYLFQELGIGKV